MKTLGLVLSLTFALIGASIAGSSTAGLLETSVPSIGTFSYIGDPIEGGSPSLVVAVR